MTDAPVPPSDRPAEPSQPAPAIEPVAWTPPAPLEPVTAPVGATATAAERPELLVAGAFAGGMLAALILKRIAS